MKLMFVSLTNSPSFSHSQVDFGFAKFIKNGCKTFTFAGTPEV